MFGKRLEIFRLFGFPIRVDLSWLLILFLVTYSLASGYFPVNHPGMPVTAYWAMAFVAAIGLFLSILFHELAHSLVGRHYQLPIDGITLFIFGGVAEMREEAASPRVEFLMSVVGPLASGLLALLCFFLRHWAELHEVNRGLELIFYYLGFMNLILALFNLVPAFPLDGGRMFRSLLWALKKDYDWATRIASRIGWGFGWLLVGYGGFRLATGNAFGGLWYIMIGFFLKQASSASGEQIILKQRLERAPVTSVMQTHFPELHPEDRMAELQSKLGGLELYSHYPVTEAGTLTGYLSLARLQELSAEEWQYGRVSQFLERDIVKLSIDFHKNAWDAMEAMRLGRVYNLFVTHDGQLLGLITAKDLLSLAQSSKQNPA
ncbi:MAG: site-2 protease family protein [bacterium]